MARFGPQLRSPSGGNLAAATKARGVGDGVDHRRDDAFGAEIERAARHRELVERHAHDRRGAARHDRADAGDGRGDVPQPVLHVDRDGGKAFARHRLGDDRRGQRAPAGVDGFAGAQAAGEGRMVGPRQPLALIWATALRHQLVHGVADLLLGRRPSWRRNPCELCGTRRDRRPPRSRPSRPPWRRRRRPAPDRPSFSAAHRPSSLLRRAFALNRSSSSCANFFSKPSSRLSNVVMPPSLNIRWTIAS